MKCAYLIVLVLSVLLAGCSGDSSPVNNGKDRPVPAKPVPAKNDKPG
jgi:PBP1b-binding outer membrane lipoprotein LpoB